MIMLITKNLLLIWKLINIFERLRIYIDNMDYVIKVAEKHNCSEEIVN